MAKTSYLDTVLLCLWIIDHYKGDSLLWLSPIPEDGWCYTDGWAPPGEVELMVDAKDGWALSGDGWHYRWV